MLAGGATRNARDYTSGGPRRESPFAGPRCWFTMAGLRGGLSADQFRLPGCFMALELVRTRFKNNASALQTFDLIPVYLVGIPVIFASLGMGEAVYRLLFSDYDGAKDRLPIEIFFGLIFAWLAISFVRNLYQHRQRTMAKLHVVWDRNHQIRAALEALSPHPHTSRNQQSIRVIREELDRIERELKEVLPRQA